MLSSELQIDARILFYKLISERLGIKVRQVNTNRLNQFVECRLKHTRLSFDDYLRRLSEQVSTVTDEWQLLTQCITNNESFFFRDEGLFILLRTIILPELLDKRRHNKRLRIWSAACSRGEEIYSIAILLHEMSSSIQSWRLEIFGSDINDNVLATAMTGRYSEWSLRALTEQQKVRYFKKINNEWYLSSEIRQMVSFHYLNLISETTPNDAWMQNMDLILCRNVFIYFSPEAIRNSVLKLEQALSQDGILITGHAELESAISTGLVPEVLPGSLVYRRAGAVITEPPMLINLALPQLRYFPKVRQASTGINRRHQVTTKTQLDTLKRPTLQNKQADENWSTAVTRALDLFNQREYSEAIAILSTVQDRSKEARINICKLEAQSWTNIGYYENALKSVAEAISLDPFSAELFYLNAYIYELKGDKSEAIKALEKSIYLDSQFIPAYIELSALLELSSRSRRVKRLRQTALNLLSQLPDTSELFPYAGIQVVDIKQLLKELSQKESQSYE